MKRAQLTQSILLTGSVALLTACGGAGSTSTGSTITKTQTGSSQTGTSTVTTPTETGTQTTGNSNLRSTDAEIALIRSKAKNVSKNTQGYWEADFGNGLVMIYVPKNSFTMGNNQLNETTVKGAASASPAHKVTLDHYWISKYPVTTGQFRAFVTSTGFKTDVEKATRNRNGCFVYDFIQEAFMPKLGYQWDNAYKDILTRHPEITLTDQHPVSCVSWHDAIAYTHHLSKSHGLSFTLPTEAEWEFAARGTDGRVYPWGNETPDGTRANYADDTFNRYFPNLEQSDVHFGVDDGFAITSPVGSFPNGASPVGALDMAGNLTEWIYDSDYQYTASAKTNPINTSNNGIKMQKAGFWAGSAGRVGVTPNEIINGHNIRADARQGDDARSADDHLGFRVAISYTARK